MVEVVVTIAEAIISFNFAVAKAMLRPHIPDMIGYSYMFGGAYVMLKGITGAENALRPIAFVSGMSVLGIAVIAP